MTDSNSIPRPTIIHPEFKDKIVLLTGIGQTGDPRHVG